jgi:hypothetical protein
MKDKLDLMARDSRFRHSSSTIERAKILTIKMEMMILSGLFPNISFEVIREDFEQILVVKHY